MKNRNKAALLGGAASVLQSDIPQDGEPGFRGFDPISRLSTICFADDGGDGDGGGSGGGDADKQVQALTGKVNELLDELKKVKAKNREFETKDAERKTEEAKAEEERQRAAGDFEKIEKDLNEKLQAAQDEGLKWRSKYEDGLVNSDLNTALDKAGVRPEMREAVTTMIHSKNDFDISDDGKVSIGGKAVSDFVGEWAGGDGKAFISNGSSGAGASGSGRETGGAGKTVTRSAFDAMPPTERMAHTSSGGTVTDG